MMMLTTSMMKPLNIQRHLFMIHQADIYECGLNNIAILEDLNTIMVIFEIKFTWNLGGPNTIWRY